jgi:putative salt-induced outer membrane protein YdiY
MLAVAATARADEIVLESGARVIGTIKELKGKRLHVRTKEMGVVRIRKDSIVEIRTERPLTVELETGERLIGTLTMHNDLVAIVGEESTLVVPIEEVRLVEKPQPGAWGRLDVDASGGVNVVRGNSRTTTYRLDGRGTMHHDASRTKMALSTTVNEREDKPDTRRATFDLGHEYFGNDRVGFGGFVNLEKNESSDLDLRAIATVAIGYEILQGPRHRLEPTAGMAWISEKFVDTDREEGFEGTLGLAYRLKIGAMRFEGMLATFPFNSERTLINFDSKLRFELLHNLDLDITYYDRYNSDPPIATENRDYGFTIGLGWSN